MPEQKTRPRKVITNNTPGDEEHEDIKLQITEIRKALWGTNGNVGLVGRMNLVENIVSDIKKLLWAILGIVLGIAIGGIWQAIAHAVSAGVAR